MHDITDGAVRYVALANVIWTAPFSGLQDLGYRACSRRGRVLMQLPARQRAKIQRGILVTRFAKYDFVLFEPVRHTVS